MAPEVQLIISQLDAHRAKFEGFCRSLLPDELDRPVPQSAWLVRDFIAHLATIDGPVRVMFERMTGAGSPPPSTDTGSRAWDVDRWNDRRVAERRGRSLDELFAEAAAERTRMHEALASLSESDIRKTLHFGGDNKRPPAETELRAYLRGWVLHDPIHVADMLRALPGRDTPDVRAWLAEPAVAAYQRAMNG